MGKKLLSIIITTAMLISVSISPVFAEKITIRYAHVLDTSSPIHLGALKFKELVEQKTPDIEVKIFPQSQLGGERDIAEGLRMGSIEMGDISSVVLTGFLKKASVFGLPYLYRSREHAVKVVDGPIGTEFITNDLKAIDLRGLAFSHHGFRHMFTTGKMVNGLSDMAGIKIRIQEDPVQRDLWEALGASPVPVPYPELYTSLQTGVVDAAEQPPASIITMRFYEVSKNLVLTSHYYQTSIILVSKMVWDKLSEQQKTILTECAKESTKFEREKMWEKNDSGIEELKSLGMTVNKIDIAPFVEKTESVRVKWAGKVDGGTELVQKIVSVE